MSNWLKGLLLEWRRGNEDARASRAEPGVAVVQFRALWLISKHVKDAGILLRLTEVAGEASHHTKARVSDPTRPLSPPPDAGLLPLERAAFGKRLGHQQENDAPRSDPLTRPPQALTRLRSHGRDGAKHPAYESYAASRTKSPIDELSDLRTQVAHLKESVAELLVENLLLRKRLGSDIHPEADGRDQTVPPSELAGRVAPDSTDRRDVVERLGRSRGSG